jgi:hypothetical protein
MMSTEQKRTLEDLAYNLLFEVGKKNITVLFEESQERNMSFTVRPILPESVQISLSMLRDVIQWERWQIGNMLTAEIDAAEDAHDAKLKEALERVDAKLRARGPMQKPLRLWDIELQPDAGDPKAQAFATSVSVAVAADGKAKVKWEGEPEKDVTVTPRGKKKRGKR